MSPIEQVGPALPTNRLRRVENRNRRDDGKRPSRTPDDRERTSGKADPPDEREHKIDELA